MAATAQVDAGQHDAARALYERYYPNVYRYALSQVRSPQDAEDAAQNTFLRAFAALQRGIVPENESAWLFKIAHNVCASSRLAWLRRRRVETPRDLDALKIEPAAREVRSDELLGLGDALASMPPRLREAFLLREWQGLSYDEIATRLDTSRSAVETLIFRARRALAAELEAPVQKLKHALGLGPLLAALRGVVEGAGPVAKAAAVLAVAGGATLASQPLIDRPGNAKAGEARTAVERPAKGSSAAVAPRAAATQPHAAARKTAPRRSVRPQTPAASPATASTPSVPLPSSPPQPPAFTPVAVPPALVPPPVSAPAAPPIAELPPVAVPPGLPPQLPAPVLPELPAVPQLPALPVPALPTLPELPKLP